MGRSQFIREDENISLHMHLTIQRQVIHTSASQEEHLKLSTRHSERLGRIISHLLLSVSSKNFHRRHINYVA